jgi:hypothetical protein
MLVKIYWRWFFDSKEKALLNSVAQPTRQSYSGTKDIIVIQAPADHYYLCLYGMLVANIKKGTPIGISAIYSDMFTIRPVKKKIILSSIIYFFDSLLIKRKWKKLYSAIGVNSFIEIERSNIFEKTKYLFYAFKAWKKFKTKEQILNFSINNIECGDLIYDTYLRYEVRPTVIISDSRLIYYIYKAYCVLNSVTKLTTTKSVRAYYSSYATYIQHGLPVRYFLKKGIEVITSGNLQQKFKKLSLQDYYHTAPHLTYNKIFNSLPNKDLNIQAGINLLNEKFAGVITRANSYMKKSVFADPELSLFSDTYDGVVFLHDFFDSPHIYSWMLFPDFYDWTTYTLNFIQKNDLNIAIKPHPNQSEESQKVIEDLKMIYKNVQWIDPAISNSVILKSKIKFGISVYGTVLHELAYHGKNPICAGDNPHSAFNFVHTPSSIESYELMILENEKLTLPVNYMNEIGSFYFMHNIYDKDDILVPIGELKDFNVFNSDSSLIKKTLLNY